MHVSSRYAAQLIMKKRIDSTLNFERTLVRKKPPMRVSRCKCCNEAVGAAPKGKTLALVESIHRAAHHARAAEGQ
jgi:hypothetical protein